VTAFVGALAGPHIGRCQNLIRGEREDWRDAYYCLAPVIGLGANLPTDSDICQVCRERSRLFVERLREAYVTALVADADAAREWVALARALLTDLDVSRVRRAAQGAPMADLFKIDRDIAMRETLLDAVLTAQKAYAA
jgi:hypothetical protein